MVYKEIISIFESRHENLSNLLECTDLTSTEKHEMIGALNELSIVLKTLNEERELNTHRIEEKASINLSEHEEFRKPGFFSKILSSISNKDAPGSFPE